MSKLSEVLTDFNFGEKTASGEVIPEAEVQKAFLENLYLAGYFKPEFIWQAINLMQYDNCGNIITTYDEEAREYRRRWDKAGGVDAVFLELSKAIIAAKADQDDPEKFKPEVLLENLFKSEIFDRQDVEDMVVYLGQIAFRRSVGQERMDLKKEDWQDKHKDRYLKNARKIGIIEAVTYDKDSSFDEAWIQGATRSGVAARIQSLKDSDVQYRKVKMLTGDRELSVDLDKTGAGKEEEAKAFLSELAKENNVKICGFELRTDGRTSAIRNFPKYEDGETKKLTETMVAKKVYRDIFGKELEEDEVVDSTARESESRPDTYKTATDATRGLLIEKCKADGKPVKILIVSNQPYVDRQVLTNKRAVKEAMKKEGIEAEKVVSFFGFGKKCGAGVTTIHSEFGCLVNEGFMQRSCERDMPRKFPTENLMSSNRCEDLTKVPPMLLVTAKPRGEKVETQQSLLVK